MKTIGIFGDARLGLSAILQNEQSAEGTCHVRDYTKAGCDASEGLWILRREKAVLRQCDAVILAFGWADWAFDWAEIADEPYVDHDARVPMRDFLAAVRSMISEVRSAGARPILLSLPELDSRRYLASAAMDLDVESILDFLGGDEEFLAKWQEDYSNMLGLLAAETHSQIIPLREAFAAQGGPSRLLASDGLTPNEAGRKVIAGQLSRALTERSASGKRVFAISSRMPGMIVAASAL